MTASAWNGRVSEARAVGVQPADDGFQFGVIAWGGSAAVKAIDDRSTYYYVARGGACIIEFPSSGRAPVIVPKNAVAIVDASGGHVVKPKGGQSTGARKFGDTLRSFTDVSIDRAFLLAGRIARKQRSFATDGARVQLVTEEGAPKIHSRILRVFALAESELRHGDADAGVAVHLLADVLRIYVERVDRDVKQDPAPAPKDLKQQSLMQAMTAFGNDPCHDWNLATLSKRAGMSRTAFAVGFRDLTGKTPMEAVRRARLEKAMHSLKATAFPIETVAINCGYGSSSAFVRAFKREFGVSPGQYRRDG